MCVCVRGTERCSGQWPGARARGAFGARLFSSLMGQWMRATQQQQSYWLPVAVRPPSRPRSTRPFQGVIFAMEVVMNGIHNGWNSPYYSSVSAAVVESDGVQLRAPFSVPALTIEFIVEIPWIPGDRVIIGVQPRLFISWWM